MSNPEKLCARELEAVRHVLAGKSNKEIARAMGIELGTVTGYLKIARLRTGTRNRVGLALWAERNGVAQ